MPLHPQWSLTGQVARGFREPLLSDRYYRGISGRGFITGNPDLDPETSRQADLALRWNGDGVRVALFGFLYRIDDLIERYKVGSNYFFRNRGEAEIKGVELEGTLDLGASLLVQLALQRQRGEVREDGSAMDSMPSDGVVLTLRRDPAQSWWWLARVAAYARDERPGPTEREVPGYTVVDGGLGYRVSDSPRASAHGSQPARPRVLRVVRREDRVGPGTIRAAHAPRSHLTPASHARRQDQTANEKPPRERSRGGFLLLG